MHRTAFAAGFAFAVGLGGVTTAQAGGLLDFLFGWKDRTDIQRAAPAPVAHPDITISGKQKPRKVARNKAREPRVAAVGLSPKEQLARTIDPNKNPNWYLEDPTLRKGDILVLNDRVVVFTGGALGAPKSYVALSRAKLLTRKERERVAAMTGGALEPSMLANAGPARQPRLLKSVSLTRPAPLGQREATDPRS